MSRAKLFASLGTTSSVLRFPAANSPSKECRSALRHSFDGEFAAGNRRTELVVPSEANNFARLIQLFATAGFCVWRGGAAHDPGDSIKQRRAEYRDKRGIQADFAELARLRRLT